MSLYTQIITELSIILFHQQTLVVIWFLILEWLLSDVRIHQMNICYSLMQKFIAVRKEDAGEYYCRAKNDAGYSECLPQQMEVCKCLIYAACPLCWRNRLCIPAFSLEIHRWHWRCWDCAGSAGGGRSAVVHHSRDLLRIQARIFLQPKTDGEQVRHQGIVSLKIDVVLFRQRSLLPPLIREKP